VGEVPTLLDFPGFIGELETFTIGMDRYQGNVSQTAAKNVRIPGMPTAQSIREEVEGPPPDTRPAINFNLPQPMTVNRLITGR